MGIAPLWGFQMIVAIALSIYFKFNKVLVLIAANISFPPLIPLIIYLSHLVGRIWMGKDAVTLNFDAGLSPDVIYKSFTLLSVVQYILGSITLGLLGAGVFGLITFLILKASKRKTIDG
ncbi:MAG TPA: DUF2062 domain-containing protein [Cyclobacteriaceae bacterium]